MKRLFYIILLSLISSYASAQTIQELILKDKNLAIVPDSFKQVIKGRWDWTNGVDSLSLYFLENEFFDFESKFGKPNLITLIGHWYYKRYNSVTIGHRYPIYNKDELPKNPGNLLDLSLAGFWEPKKGLLFLTVKHGENKLLIGESLNMRIKLIDHQTILLLYDGYLSEYWAPRTKSLFHEFLIPSNIVLTKNCTTIK